jgi:LmbE family N-acetylglucosaminyl deacetylase
MGEVLRRARAFLVTCLLPACILAILLIPSGCSLVEGKQDNQGTALPGADVASLGKRVLVVAPHPDDEGLAAAGLIQQALRQGAEVKVVVVTAGDASAGAARTFSNSERPTEVDFRLMGNARCQETRDALKALGVPSPNVIFLAYADGSVNSLWDIDWDYRHLHMGRNGADHSPYSFAYEKNAPYCGSNLEKNLTSVIKDDRPTSIVYPDAEDHHHDHWATNAFVQYVVLRSGYRGSEYTYLVHRRDFPSPLGFEPLTYLDLPTALKDYDARWETLPLSRRQQDNKARALQAYRIPKMVKEAFIDSFVRRNEIFGEVKKTKAERIGAGRPNFTGKRMPYVVEEYSRCDSLVPTAGRGGELTRASFCLGEKQAFMAVETGGNVLGSLTYAFRLRVFKGHRVDRFDIDVREGKAHCAVLASNSVSLRERIPVHVKENRLWIELPASVFSGKDAFMMSVDSMDGPNRVDRTAWRRFTL